MTRRSRLPFRNTAAFAAFALLAVILAGCGREGDPAEGASAVEEPVSVLTIRGNDRMRFEPRRFTVRAGSEITLTFVNVGSMPKETMGHNWVLLQPGVAPRVFSAAAITHPRTAYIPPQFADQVIAASAVLGPGESEQIVFTAPREPGVHPFVCSFPGHTEAGMAGTMTVVE
jgi:azurin